MTGYRTGLEFIDANNPVCQRAIAHLVGVASNEFLAGSLAWMLLIGAACDAGQASGEQ